MLEHELPLPEEILLVIRITSLFNPEELHPTILFQYFRMWYNSRSNMLSIGLGLQLSGHFNTQHVWLLVHPVLRLQLHILPDIEIIQRHLLGQLHVWFHVGFVLSDYFEQFDELFLSGTHSHEWVGTMTRGLTDRFIFSTDMCDCNITSYWNGIICAPRLAANMSCSYAYQCQAGFTCIVNETTLGIFSDVCRCPLGNYFVNGSGCIPSVNYSQSCVGSYQCYEPAPLSCRYSATGVTCLDTSLYTLPRCDCADNYFYNETSGLCKARLSRLDTCNLTCQCTPPFECITNQCDCLDYYSSINRTCVSNLWYGDQCSNTADCEATPNAFMTCFLGTCRCNSSGLWNGTQCSYGVNFRATCTSSATCVGGLVCRSIACIGGASRCSCSTTSYFSFASQACISCTGSEANSFNRYVINYPTSDICVAVRDSGSSGSSVTFTQADTYCSGFTSFTTGGPPQLLSVHNGSELNCIAAILRGQLNQRRCTNNQYYYLGYFNANGTFYDGTVYSSVFSSPILSPTTCLTYCSASSSSGQLNSNICSGASGGVNYGAICDYRVT